MPLFADDPYRDHAGRLQRSSHLLRYILTGLLLTLLAALLPGATAAAGPLSGAWVGSYMLDGRSTFIRATLDQRDAALAGALSIRQEGAANLPILQGRIDQQRVQMRVAHDPLPLELDGRIETDRISGQLRRGDERGEFQLLRTRNLAPAAFERFVGDYRLPSGQISYIDHWGGFFFQRAGPRLVQLFPLTEQSFFAETGERIAFSMDAGGAVDGIAVTAPDGRTQQAPRAQLYTSEPVRFQSGAVTLAGTLLLPPGSGSHPAVVFVHGAGSSTREQQRVLADHFARSGIAALIYDKRGSGESGGDWRGGDFDDLAADAQAAVALLTRRAEIDPAQIGLWGISEGGWVAPLAATRSSDVAFVILVSAAATGPIPQELYRREMSMRAAGYDDRVVDTGVKAWFMLFDGARLVRAALPEDLGFFARTADYAPLPTLRQLTQPVLAIYGGLDSSVPPRASAAQIEATLHEANHRDYTVETFPAGNHGLELVSTASRFEVRREISFVPGYLEAMTDWVQAQTAHGDRPAVQRVAAGAVRQPASGPVERTPLPSAWYSRAIVQLPLFGCFALVFAWALAARRSPLRQHAPDAAVGARRARRLARLLSALNLLLLLGIVLFVLLVIVLPDVLDNVVSEWRVPLLLSGLPLLGLLSAGLAGAMAICAGLSWRRGYWSRAGRVGYTLLAVAALSFTPFLVYWNMAGGLL
jgi:hypothetical protein